jgi:Superfamily II DNA helicase
MAGPSKVHWYKAEEIDMDNLAAQALSILGVKPFTWQLKITAAILRGEDVIVDVGTGSGKTLCFSLPLLLHDTDIVMVVSPLTALMIDQVGHRRLGKCPKQILKFTYRQTKQYSQQ